MGQQRREIKQGPTKTVKLSNGLKTMVTAGRERDHAQPNQFSGLLKKAALVDTRAQRCCYHHKSLRLFVEEHTENGQILPRLGPSHLCGMRSGRQGSDEGAATAAVP